MMKSSKVTIKLRQGLIYLALIATVFFANSAYAEMQVLYKEIVANDSLPMVMRYYKEVNPKNTLLTRKGNSFTGANDPETVLLANYYNLMINKKFQQVAALYYEADGSKQRYLQRISALPDSYDNYSNLTHVRVQERYGWGPFKVITLELLGKNNRKMKWREALICQIKGCLLSNVIEQPDDKFNLYGFYATRKNSKISQDKLAKAFAKGSPVLWLPANAQSYTGFKQYPVSVVVSIEKEAQQIPSLAQSATLNLNVSGHNIKPMLTFIQSIKNLGLEVDQTEPEKLNQEKIAKKLDKILKEHVVKEGQGYEFNLVSQFTSTPEVKVEWYNPIAALQRISNWEKLTVLGSMTIENGDGLVVYFQPERKNADNMLVEPVQLFILRKNPDDLWFVTLEAKNSRIAYLYNEQLVNSIQSRYGKPVNFIYQDPEQPRS